MPSIAYRGAAPLLLFPLTAVWRRATVTLHCWLRRWTVVFLNGLPRACNAHRSNNAWTYRACQRMYAVRRQRG